MRRAGSSSRASSSASSTRAVTASAGEGAGSADAARAAASAARRSRSRWAHRSATLLRVMPSSQPGRLPVCGLKPRPAAPGGDEDLLGDVLGVVPVAEGAQRDGEHQRRPAGVGGSQPLLAPGPERLLELDGPARPAPAAPAGHRPSSEPPRCAGSPPGARSQGQHHPTSSAPANASLRSAGPTPDAVPQVKPAGNQTCRPRPPPDATAPAPASPVAHWSATGTTHNACSGVGAIPSRR